MALVYDPVLQRYVDDGRPAPDIAFAGGIGAAVQNAVNIPNQVAGAAAQNAVNIPNQVAGGVVAAVQNPANIPNQVAGATAQNAIDLSRQVARGAGAARDKLIKNPPELVKPSVVGLPGLALPTAAASAGLDFVLGDTRTAPATATVGGPQFGAVGGAIPQPAAAPASPVLSEDILAQTNAGIVGAPAQPRQQAAAAAAAPPAPTSNGVNFGFGVGGSETARQYLDRMAAQDAEAAAQAAQGGIVRDMRREADRLSSTSTVGDIALARQRNAMRQPALAATNEQAMLATSGRQQREQEQLKAEAQLGIAGANNEAAMAREVAGREITGRYGLMQAEADAMGRMALQQQKDESPEGLLARQRAIQLQLQQDAYVDALVNGDQELALRIMANQGPGTVKLQTDPVQGRVLSKMLPNGKLVPLTPEEAAIYGQ